MADDTSPDVSRRRFLELTAGALVSLGVLFTAIPFVASLIATRAGAKEPYSAVGPVGALGTNEPMNLTFSDVQQEAYIHETVVRNIWAVKHPSGDIVVYSPICPHLGCQYAWDTSRKRFVCPCHTSVWNIDGKLLSGPAPRNLDTLPSKVENGTLLVKWERFKVATPEKIPVT